MQSWLIQNLNNANGHANPPASRTYKK